MLQTMSRESSLPISLYNKQTNKNKHRTGQKDSRIKKQIIPFALVLFFLPSPFVQIILNASPPLKVPDENELINKETHLAREV
jgi:hypothetical protein